MIASLARTLLYAAGITAGLWGMTTGSSATDYYNSDVTQTTINTTICVPGWAASVRPDDSWTAPIKRDLLDKLPPNVSHESKDYELDHWVPIELGGKPKPIPPGKELILEPIEEARIKDQMENAVKRAVCVGLLTLHEGRAIFLEMRRP